MTRSEFEKQRAQLPCQGCGHVGLEPEVNANNGGVRPRCPACGSKTPLAGIQWLPKDSAEARRPRSLPGQPSTEQVWAANGDHCAFCGKPRLLCERLGIGLQAQHLHPVLFSQDEALGPLIPFCARCQQASAAALEETRRILGTLTSLDAIIARIERAHPELVDDGRRQA
jgi:hypothetical protein